jgi:hypothetical protein
MGYYVVTKAKHFGDKGWYEWLERELEFKQRKVVREFYLFCRDMFTLFSKVMSKANDGFYRRFYRKLYSKYLEKQGVTYSSFVLKALPNGYMFAPSRDMSEDRRLLFAAEVVRDCAVALNRYTLDARLRQKIDTEMCYVLESFFNCFYTRE